MNITTLTAADALRYRELMLEAYTLAADAYTSTAQDRAREPESWWVNRVADASGLTVSFAAEIDGALVGTVALEYSSKPKTKHSVLVIGMYVRGAALDQEKLSPLLRLKYQALSDAFAELGKPEQVRGLFVGFQRFLYEKRGTHKRAGA